MSRTLSPDYLHALLSTHYIPYDARSCYKSKNNSVFSLIKDRQISNSTHESLYCKKKMFDVSFTRTHPFWSHDMLGHYSSLQSIRLSPDECTLASGGEDGRLLLWDIQEAIRSSEATQTCPGRGSTELVCKKPRGFYSVTFGAGGDQVAGSGDGFLLLADVHTRDVIFNIRCPRVWELAAHPSCEALFASASDSGQVYIWDRRMPGQIALEVATMDRAFKGVQFHPTDPSFLATANIDSGAALYDVRQPNKPCLLYKLGTLARRKEHVTHITFNSSGNQVLVQILEHDPLLFEASSGEPICRFFHLEMKNRVSRHPQKGCFLGMEDEYVAVGSEDFRIYVWKVPPHPSNSLSTCSNEMLDLCHMPHLVLPGHRSIVSKLLFSKKNQLVFSAGVEKMVKVWSPWKLPSSQSQRHSSHTHISRSHYSRWQYIELLMTNGRLSPQLIPSEPHEPTLEEDPVMMAYYDVQIDDFSSNAMFFTPDSEMFTSSDDISDSSFFYVPDSDLLGELSTGTSYTTDGSSMGGFTVGEDDNYYDSDEDYITDDYGVW